MIAYNADTLGLNRINEKGNLMSSYNKQLNILAVARADTYTARLRHYARRVSAG